MRSQSQECRAPSPTSTTLSGLSGAIRSMWELWPMLALAALLRAGVAEAVPKSLVETAQQQGSQPRVEPNWWQSVRHRLELSEYHVSPSAQSTEAGAAVRYVAPNRAQDLRATFSADGVSIEPRTEAGRWSWGLALEGFGPAAEVVAKDNRIELRRRGLTEWYVNAPRGLEQGFTLEAPPAGRAQVSGRVELKLRVSGTLRPELSDNGQSLKWRDGEGEIELLYTELVVQDATGRSLPARFDLHQKDGGDDLAFGIVVEAQGAKYPVIIDPLATSANWSIEGGQLNANLGWSVATAGDVNGDGYSDVMIGVAKYDHGESDEGRVYVYPGGAHGLGEAGAWVAEGNQAGAEFGTAVGTAGDVNGDGFSDVIIGADRYSNGHAEEGKVFVYYGSASGLSASPSWSAEGSQAGARFGSSVGTAGDVNGDGYSDVIIGAPEHTNGQTEEGRVYVYFGGASGLGGSGAWVAEGNDEFIAFGSSVGTAGDVNGDGYSDIVIGARQYSHGETNEGRAYVYYGKASGLGATHSWSTESGKANAYLGNSVGTAGDVNGDGYADVIIGADWYDNGLTKQGRVYVFPGSAAGLGFSGGWIANGTQSEAHFGCSVGTAGDVNGDGYADVIIGAELYSNGQVDEGRSYVYYGTASGLGPTPNWSAEANQSAAWFGFSVATAGDVNGDGYSDVIVGAPFLTNGQSGEGKVSVFHGSSLGLAAAAGWSLLSSQPDAALGNSVASAGDVDGDGYSDVIVGAHWFSNGQNEEGRVYVLHGGATGLSSTPVWSGEGDQTEAHFGASVASAGDVNGDGYSDVIIGAPDYDNGLSDEGQVLVVHGGPSGIGLLPDWTKDGDWPGAHFGNSVATAGDVNGDGYSDVIIGAVGHANGENFEGRAYVYHGSPSGLAATPAWTVEGNLPLAHLGSSVASAGDVNRDGYSDVIVGADNVANGEAAEGRAYVYHGGAAGLSTSPAWSAEGNLALAEFGSSVSTAGDVNGDGYSDVIVGAVGFTCGQNREGSISIFQGGALGLGPTASWLSESGQANSGFGISVATAGDFDGDGYSDIIAGAPYADSGEHDEGRVFAFRGSATGVTLVGAWDADIDRIDAKFGYSVATAGDINGDGFSDVIIGAPEYGSSTAISHIYVYYGNGGRGPELRARQRRADDTAPVSALGRAGRPDAFNLAVSKRTAFGRGRVRLEWEVHPLANRLTGVPNGEQSDWSEASLGSRLLGHVQGLTGGAAYHWQLRLRYDPVTTPFQSHSRWLTGSWNGRQEADLRTLPAVLVPSMGKAAVSLLLVLLALELFRRRRLARARDVRR